MDPTPNSTRRFQDTCLCAVFLAFLFAPLAAFSLRRGDGSVILVENRKAADFPPRPSSALEWAAWPRAFEAWHDDFFGLRSTLVRAHNVLKIWGLHTTPTPRIVVGPTLWIFGAGVDLDPWRGANPFTLLELEAWRRCLESRQIELEKRGIDYYFVLGPSKAAIYPELLPTRYRKGGPSRTDQLVAHLAKHSSFQVIDLRAALLEEKRNDIGDDYTYYPLGTHWTDRGVLAGTRAVVAELAKAHPEVARIDDRSEGTVLVGGPGDSWAERLYLGDVLEQRIRHVILHDASTRALAVAKLPESKTVVVDQEDATLPCAVVFHDSFGVPMQVMLGRHFSHSVFVWKPEIDLAVVEREHPDVLMHIFSDRVLETLQPRAFYVESDTRALEQYEASREVALNFNAAKNSPPIRPFQDASVTLRGEGGQARVACKMDNPASAFLLPEFKSRRGMHPVVRLEFESPIETKTSVLFQTQSDRTFTRKRQLRYEVRPGLNTLYVEILEEDLAGPLLFRPGAEAETFLLSALEVRLVAN